CDPLCGSTPIITAAIDCPFPLELRRGPVAGRPNSRSISGRTSFEPRHGKGPTGWHIDIKPDHNGRQAVREPAHRTPQTLRPTPQRPPETIRRRVGVRLSTQATHLWPPGSLGYGPNGWS